jgi:hypothetical protein
MIRSDRVSTGAIPGEIMRPLLGLIPQLNKDTVHMGHDPRVVEKAMKTGGKMSVPMGIEKRRQMGPMGRLDRSEVLDRKLNGWEIPRDRMGQIDAPGPPEDEPQPNRVEPVTRIIKPFAKDVASPSTGELVLLYQKDDRNMQVIQLEDSSMLQRNPLTEINVATWNQVAAKNQWELFQRDETKYKQSTPIEWFKLWKVDGVMEQDDNSGKGFTFENRRNHVTTIAARGKTSVYPYWKNTIAGSDCWLIIKKYHYEEGNTTYTVNTKFNGNGSVRQLTALAPLTRKFKPFQIGFYSCTLGGFPPIEELRYTDEEGNWHNDAHLIFLGTVQAPPIGDCSGFDNESCGNDELECPSKAFTNSNEPIKATDITKMELNLNCDNGFMPF